MAAINSESVSREDIKAAIARAVELRAVHAALMQGASPTHPKLLSSSSPPPPHLSAYDYPVFTPTYEEEPVSGYHQLQVESRMLSEAWDDDQSGVVAENGIGIMQLDEITENGSSRNNLALALVNFGENDMRSVTSSCTNQITVHQTSPAAELLKSRRSILGDAKSVSSCNKCSTKHGDNNDADSIASSSNHFKQSNFVLPRQPKSKGMMFSWLLPRSKKKPKSESSPLRIESEEVETLKKELLDANNKRAAALAEVEEMKSSFGDLRNKLENLEKYCDELKKALKQTSVHPNIMPASEDVMVERFLQMVSESRHSVNRFCKTLVKQIDENDDQLKNNLNTLLQPYIISLTAKCSKFVLYHLEAIINQVLYQDFENCIFQKNGYPKILDPQQDRQAKFSSFVALRNLSWNEVIRKGTKYYSEELSKFCDQKMSCIVSALNWIRPWPEQLLQSFFVAAKCIWLLHLLAFSFYPPLIILRVEENREFDPHYMEDVPTDRQKRQAGSSRVKIMVMPGYYVQDQILKCKVLCRYKSAT